MRSRLTLLALTFWFVVAAPCVLQIPQSLGIAAVSADSQRTDVVTPPVAIYTRQPDSIPQSDHYEYQGTAVLEIEVGPLGNVSFAKVLKPVGHGLDEKALETVRTWKFKPGMVNGHPTRFRVRVEVTFSLVRGPHLDAPCPIPFAFAEMDWDDPKKLTWGEFSDDVNNWWARQKDSQKFSSLCVASPSSARYAIVWRPSYTYTVSAADGSKRTIPDRASGTSPKRAVEVFQMSKGEVEFPALFTSKSASSKKGFKEAVNYLSRRLSSSQ